jgi:hypothetical protein
MGGSYNVGTRRAVSEDWVVSYNKSFFEDIRLIWVVRVIILTLLIKPYRYRSLSKIFSFDYSTLADVKGNEVQSKRTALFEYAVFSFLLHVLISVHLTKHTSSLTSIKSPCMTIL